MMKIRLQRHGAKKSPFYRLVVADARAPRDGRFVDMVGYYNPTKNPAIISVQEDKVMEWLNKGAQLTDTAKSILSKAGVIAKFAAQAQAK